MKKIEKKLLLLDFENTLLSYDRRIKMLDNIIMYYLDNDDLDSVESNINTNIEKFNNSYIFEEEEEDEIEEPKEQEDKKEDKKEEEVIKEKEIIKKEELPSDIKNIYRKIMMVTHPDKLKNKLKKEEYSELYRKSVDAKNKNDISEIMFIAYKLNIEDIYDVDIQHFNKIRYKIARLNLESKGIENSPYWMWYYSDDENVKKIMDSYIKKFR